MTSHIRLDIAQGVAQVRLDRPDKRNALSFRMISELLQVGRQLGKDRSLRAVVLSGEGEAFCSGIDLHDLRDPANRVKALWELSRPGPNLFQQVFLVWRELPVPVLALLHGHCYGAGMQLALGADIRIATPDSHLAIMEARWGLVPDMGASVTLRHLVGLDAAKELMMTARVVSGVQARDLGLVSHVAGDPLAKATEIIAEILERSPDAVTAAKRLCNAMATDSPASTIGLEKRLQLRLLMGENFKIAAKRAKDATLAWHHRTLK
ncbi:MAG: crotonase/enoyl-CoA hydratase family protein [Deltaproteobacteria bacterium]|nr:crotonase/enoyl-CoA hydratase family protein [Deltaproteobacteria bacterium]